MADTKITDLTSKTATTGDELVVNTTALEDRKVTAESVALLALRGSVAVSTSVVNPTSNDGVALGTSALKFSDLFLASGAVLQFSTEATNITHSASVLTIAASTIVTNSVAQSTAAIYPVTSEGVTLGTSSNRWAGVFTSSGVNFPGAQDASADVNTLDDYEEGTFTPTWTPATTGSFTIGYNSSTTGNYVKVGSKVYVQGHVHVTTFTSGTGTGQMGISGLPFTAGTQAHQGVFYLSNTTSGYRGAFFAQVTTATAVARALLKVATTGPSSLLNLADCSTGANFFDFSGCYTV